MATLLLQTAGTALGGAFGPLGAAIGSAVGSSIGYTIDQSIINSTQHIDGSRLSGGQPMSAEDGAPIARIYGYARVPTTVIWATRLQENATTERQGGKGGPKVTSYTYSVSAAFGICEGPIALVKRIWADGKELDLRDINYRIYHGDEDQMPDPLIRQKQGTDNAPAFRGIAYIVFENLQLERFGNRIPQIQVEVVRPVGKLEKNIRAVTIIPGATEFGYSPAPIVLKEGDGNTFEANRHILHGETNWQASIDELQAICPNLEYVSLVVSWYCNDLRAGHASLRPGVVARQLVKNGDPWKVAGFDRDDENVHLISKIDGRSTYGGTPSDQSVIDAIIDLKRRGLKVSLNPFILMDVTPDNQLPDPYSNGFQSPFPWRGRITDNPAVGMPDTADKTAAAQWQIDHFSGQASVSNFLSGNTPNIENKLTDFGYRQMILHNAALAKQAGGVDTFIIGSEMRGLTQIRNQAKDFPFVGTLKKLAADVRQILTDETTIIYGADWSEYFGYHPVDGSGDVIFHLDPLWSDPNISAIGIDNYMPLSDWRDTDNEIGNENPDGARWSSDKNAMKAAITSGEGYDWYYASDIDRATRKRTNITDGAYNKPWTFRYKDLVSWWSNRHYNRFGGIEETSPTAWQPQSKQIYLMEIGCPAVYYGANQPNVFVDPKSSESAIPYSSLGGRDDTEQRAYLEAQHEYWSEIGRNNPVSTVNALPMVDPNKLYIWAWDARPYPAFPLNKNVWGDGDNWLRGHWINGRIGTAPVSNLMQQIFADHGLNNVVDSSTVSASFSGMAVSSPNSIRATLEPVLSLSGAVVEDSGADVMGGQKITIEGLQAYVPIKVLASDRIDNPKASLIEKSVLQADELPNEIQITYRDPLDEYQVRNALSRRIEEHNLRQSKADVPAILEADNAKDLADRALALQWSGRETAKFSLPLSYFHVKCGNVIVFDDDLGSHWLIERIVFSHTIDIEARSISKPKTVAKPPELPLQVQSLAYRGQFGGPPEVVLMDLPLVDGGAAYEQYRIAVQNTPKRVHAIYVSPDDQGYELRGNVPNNAIMGQLAETLDGGFSGRLDRASSIHIKLPDGEFESVSNNHFLSGVNTVAIEARNGVWEIVQFKIAEEITPNQWKLSHLLRGQKGTEDALRAGANIGAHVIKLGNAIVPAGITDKEIGQQLNFRVGQQGKEFSDRYYKTVKGNGGLRALTPLAPVHIRAQKDLTGNIHMNWIRRARQYADSWLGPDIPLEEEFELYLIVIQDNQQNKNMQLTVTKPSVTVTPAEITNAFGTIPSIIQVSVSQVSQRVGAGIKAHAVLQF